MRYLKEYDYNEELIKYNNLKIIKYIDLRYIIPIADKIFTTLNTSTLGIIYASKKDGYFLNYSWNGISIKSEKEENINLPNLLTAYKISEFKELNFSWNKNFIKEII